MHFLRRQFWLLPLLVLSLGMVSGSAYALNCVEYVRKVSGLDISGDAWEWWGGANGKYERGHVPKEKAILVFNRTGAMEHGHVAIVSSILNSRLITITHANWARFRSLKGHVSSGVLVQDVSEKNDWSEVKVMDEASHAFGRTNQILGFVYGGKATGSTEVAEADTLDDKPEDGKILDIDNE
jgi:surface antigen